MFSCHLAFGSENYWHVNWNTFVIICITGLPLCRILPMCSAWDDVLSSFFDHVCLLCCYQLIDLLLHCLMLHRPDSASGALATAAHSTFCAAPHQRVHHLWWHRIQQVQACKQYVLTIGMRLLGSYWHWLDVSAFSMFFWWNESICLAHDIRYLPLFSISTAQLSKSLTTGQLCKPLSNCDSK